MTSYPLKQESQIAVSFHMHATNQMNLCALEEWLVILTNELSIQHFSINSGKVQYNTGWKIPYVTSKICYS